MANGDAYYFAYSSLLSPGVIKEVAPDASFHLIAHLPETMLVFRTASSSRREGAIPSVVAKEANTVWGALFTVNKTALAAIDAAEASNGRVPSTAFSAVDREGRRYRVTTHVVPDGTEDEPDHACLQDMVDGGMHWGLPTGWILNLEDLLEDDLLA